jgi:hypothetical protein
VTLTIEVPPEIEADLLDLLERAEAQGLRLSRYLEKLLLREMVLARSGLAATCTS